MVPHLPPAYRSYLVYFRLSSSDVQTEPQGSVQTVVSIPLLFTTSLCLQGFSTESGKLSPIFHSIVLFLKSRFYSVTAEFGFSSLVYH